MESIRLLITLFVTETKAIVHVITETGIVISVVEVKGKYVVRDGNLRLPAAQETKAKSIQVIIETSMDAWRNLTKRLYEGDNI